MREKRIMDLGERSYLGHPQHSDLQDIETMFCTRDHITNDDIRSIVDRVVAKISDLIKNEDDPAKQVSVVFQAMEPYLTFHSRSFGLDIVNVELEGDNYKFRYFDFPPDGVEEDEYDELSGESVVLVPKKDVDQAMYRIKTALLDKLKPLLGPIPLYVTEQALSNNVFEERKGDKVVKKTFGDIWFTSEYAEQITEALKLLYSDSPTERSPYIEYSLEERDSESGVEIHSRHELQNLGELTDKQNIEMTDVVKYLSYLVDNMRGADFLVQKRIGLGDISLHNMGVDKNIRRGKLFDFSMLVKDTVVVENEYYAHCRKDPKYHFYGNYSPFSRRKEEDSHVIDETEMLYQFGITLDHFLARIDENMNHSKNDISNNYDSLRRGVGEVADAINSDTQDVLWYNKEPGLTLVSVIQKLQHIIDDFRLD